MILLLLVPASKLDTAIANEVKRHAPNGISRARSRNCTAASPTTATYRLRENVLTPKVSFLFLSSSYPSPQFIHQLAHSDLKIKLTFLYMIASGADGTTNTTTTGGEVMAVCL
jgi:hypothetical protein